ncbi:MAG: MarR family winged helix-turn-helix transcriptional regulator [Acidimicrobiia bacterium]
MKTEPQKSLRPDLVDTVFPLVESIRRMLGRVDTLWSDVGLNPSEAAVLERLFIDHNGTARSGALLGHPVRSTPALGKVLSSLEDMGLIARERSTEDRRIVVVTGTAEGRDLYTSLIEQILTLVVGPTTAALDDADFTELRRITAKLEPPDPDL